jgi:tetratricopeptide (TPR) repeat protein
MKTIARGFMSHTIGQTLRHPRTFRAGIFVVYVLAVAAMVPAQSAMPRAWEAPLIIQTYELGAPDPNPPLLDWNRRRWRPVYPYTMLDELTGRRVEKSYKAVYLENEYLRVVVLPELGGHLYQIFDKAAKRDLLYTNHVVKYAMVAIRGAWVSGGIEWNFPDGHTLTTISPVDYVMRTEADGSAAVTVGDTERVQGVQWAITIRLRPGRRVVESEVTLNNRTEIPARYWFWSTAAAPATNDLRFVYPMREAYPHAFWPVFSFPVEKGFDVGTYREVTNDLSLFARHSKKDYFGVYYEKADHGVVHVADHREMAGKKTWTWGTDEAGSVWVNKLTDADGQYVEFQAGRHETQLEHEFIAPYRVEHFTEFWYPVEKLGGSFTEASADGALRVAREGGNLRITANFTSRFDGAELRVMAGKDTLYEARVNLKPAEVFNSGIAVPARFANQPLTIRFIRKDGRTLIDYRADSPVDGNTDFKPATRPLPDPAVAGSAEQVYVEGLAADKKSNERAARVAYEEALRRDPNFALAHLALARSFYRSGEYQRAAGHLEHALLRNPDLGEAHYYFGLVKRAQSKRDAAAEEFLWCVRTGEYESPSRYQLGEMALEKNDLGEALAQLSLAVEREPKDLKARTVLALACRLAGQLNQAEQEIEKVVAQVPTDYLARSEEAEITRALNKRAESKRAEEELWRLLARDPTSVLTLAFDYAATGQKTKSRKILEEAIRTAEERGTEVTEQAKKTGTYAGRVYPMFYYALGYFYDSEGEKARAITAYSKGSQGDPALVFPNRVEEIRILQSALQARPNDGRAAYYLGNALAAKNRDEEALSAWQAARNDAANSLMHRNLALALWRVVERKEEALKEYDLAIRAEPQEYHRYVEQDRLLAELKRTTERIARLEGAPPEVKKRASVIQSLTGAYIDAGRFEAAAKLLDQATFTQGEGEYGALSLYRAAHLGLAVAYRQQGSHREAAREFLKATEYPQNLGIGRPAMESLAREYVSAARELELAGQKAEAEKWWQRAAGDPLNSPTQPTEPWSEHYYWKAVALDHVGQGAEARALLERLARLANEEEMLKAEADPPRGAIRWALAGAGLQALGKPREARGAFKKALEFEPQNPFALSHLQELGAGG